MARPDSPGVIYLDSNTLCRFVIGKDVETVGRVIEAVELIISPFLLVECRGQPRSGPIDEELERRILDNPRHTPVEFTRAVALKAECRERFGLRYPLAHLRPFTDGRRLLLDAQTEAGLTGELRVIYELASGQLELHWRAVTFLERVDRGGDSLADIALALMPDGPDSPVRLEPGVASGAATVGGVRAEILREQYEVGEDTRDIAEMFRLDIHDVLAALRHEDKLRPLKIA